MLIIGHRGSAGTKPENTMAGLKEAIRSGAEMVEFDVRVTSDGVPVLHHDFRLKNKRIDLIARHTLSELRKRTSGTDRPLVTLEEALKECFGKVLINVEIKQLKAVVLTLEALEKHIKRTSDWDQVLISSFKPLVLLRVRKRAPQASLAMLHSTNGLNFILWQRQLKLSAVGFHRLHLNEFALEMAEQLNLFTYAYTVNRPEAMKNLSEIGIDGVVTDYPALFVKKR